MENDRTKVFEPGTLKPRGKYVRECDTAMKNRQYFAKKADEERDLRLMMLQPTNWFSHYFCVERTKEELNELFNKLSVHMVREGYDVSHLETFIEEELK